MDAARQAAGVLPRWPPATRCAPRPCCSVCSRCCSPWVVSWFIGTGIGRPVRRLRDSLAEIADGDGDLTKRVDASRRDELGELGAAFNRFAESIAGTVREVGARPTC